MPLAEAVKMACQVPGANQECENQIISEIESRERNKERKLREKLRELRKLEAILGETTDDK